MAPCTARAGGTGPVGRPAHGGGPAGR